MNQIEIYQTKDKQTEIEVQFEEDTVWLTQQHMAKLFGQTKQNISLHINNCFKEKELDKKAVVKDSLTTARDGKAYKTQNYNLDVIISVGYRVKSKRGTQFRQWATQRLKDHLVKGYTLNEKRLQQVVQENDLWNRKPQSKVVFCHEDRGDYVPLFNSEKAYSAMKAKEADVVLNVFKGETHSSGAYSYIQQVFLNLEKAK